MKQLTLWDRTHEALDAHFPLALPKARRMAQARKIPADVEAPVYLSDSELHDPSDYTETDYARDVCVPRCGPI